MVDKLNSTTDKGPQINFLKKFAELITPVNPPVPRFGHTVNLVSKSTVVVFGGAVSNPGSYTMTADLFLYNMVQNQWKKLECTNNNAPPQARAAHSSATVRENQLLIYGGSIGNGLYAADDLWFLDIKNNEEANWMKVPIEGLTPGQRYGHTMVYIMPILILFGGSGKNDILNDIWLLSTDKTPFKWEKIIPTGTAPVPRVYHTANLYKVAGNAEMMISFGGRAQDSASLNDIIGIKKGKNNDWEWVDFQKMNTNDYVPVQRHQHCAVFFGPFLFVVGGRTAPKDVSTFDVYSMNKMKWYKFGAISLFRHSIWIYYNIVSQEKYEVYLYIYGGFDGDNNSLINANLYKVNIVELFSKDESLKNELNDHISMLLLIQIQKKQRIMQVSQKNNDDKMFTLSSRVVAYFVGDESDDFGSLVKKYSLQKLKEENKKMLKNSDQLLGKKHIYDEELVKIFLTLLPTRDNFKPRSAKEVFPFQKEYVLKLIKDARSVIETTPTLLKLKYPIKIFGSLNGQYNDLIKYFNLWGQPSEYQGDIESFDYLFLGNFVNRGSFSLEVLCLLLSLKVKYPEQIHLLRGSQEDLEICKMYGLYEECKRKLNEDPDKSDSVFQNICILFEYLPLAATINDKILCVHSGIGENVKTLEDIINIKKPFKVSESQAALDILWSSPAINFNSEEYKSTNITSQYRKRTFDENQITEFFKNNKIDLIIRSHDTIEAGFEKVYENRIVSIFSATNYCNFYKNDGGIIFIKKNLEIQPKIIPHGDDEQGNWNTNESILKEFPPSPKRSFKIK